MKFETHQGERGVSLICVDLNISDTVQDMNSAFIQYMQSTNRTIKMHITPQQTREIVACIMAKIEKDDQVNIKMPERHLKTIQKEINDIIF